MDLLKLICRPQRKIVCSRISIADPGDRSQGQGNPIQVRFWLSTALTSLWPLEPDYLVGILALCPPSPLSSLAT